MSYKCYNLLSIVYRQIRKYIMFKINILQLSSLYSITTHNNKRETGKESERPFLT